MRRRPNTRGKKRDGFTLIELIISMAIVGVLGAGLAVTVSHIYKENIRATKHMQTVQSVENVGYWVNHDALMAQTLTPGGFPLTLTWIDSGGNSNVITYALTGQSLTRNMSINGGSPQQRVVGQYIDLDPTMTFYQFASGVLTFQVTATIDQAKETRVYQIKVRPETAPV